MTQVDTSYQLDPGLRRDDDKKKGGMTRGIICLIYNGGIVYYICIIKGYVMIGQKKSSPRGNRIAAKVQNIVAEILRDKYLDDPILGAVSIVGADAHGGLSFVRLYYYTRGDVAVVQKKLDDVTRAVRFELAARIDQKYTPEIRFVYDDTIERAERIEQLLAGLK